MKHANILTAPIALLSGSLLLASCSGWSYQPPMRGNAQVEPMNFASAQTAAPTAPASFTQSLASEYSDLARTMTKAPMMTASGDWVDSDYFSRKSLKADRGQTVQPENNANWLVPLADRIDDHWWAASRVQLLRRLRFSAKPIEREDEQ
jgi:hypothetical protein